MVVEKPPAPPVNSRETISVSMSIPLLPSPRVKLPFTSNSSLLAPGGPNSISTLGSKAAKGMITSPIGPQNETALAGSLEQPNSKFVFGRRRRWKIGVGEDLRWVAGHRQDGAAR